jgi:hypothetical protein
MATHDYVIDNGSGSTVRADINNALQAIVTVNSNNTEPPAIFDKMLWHDGTENALKQRNSSSFTGLRLFSPVIKNGLLDVNGADAIKFNPTVSAVNQFTIANAATGTAPTISATGTDTNIDITITPKGAGSLTISGTRAVRIPTGATGDRPTSPTNGMLRFNTTESYVEIYKTATTAWEPLSPRFNPSTSLMEIYNTGTFVWIPVQPGVVSAAGSAASPAVTLSTDTDTGIYWSATNELAITTGGTQRVRIRDSAMLIPVGTTAQRPASPVNGEMRYNTSIGAPEFYNSTAAEWQFPAVMANVGSGTNTLRAIFGYGYTGSNPGVSMTNLVSNAGVVATDTTGVGTARYNLAAAGYGGDKAIFGYGYTGSNVSITNLVSNTGTVASDTTGVGTARQYLAAAGYGGDKAIFGYGTTGSNVSMTNLVSNAGIVANDVTGVGTARQYLAAAGYGGDKAIFGYGYTSSNPGVSMTNLVSNAGVVAADVTGVGTARHGLAAAGYGGDKAIFGYGTTGSGNVNMTNLVSNAGVVATDTTGVGTARYLLAAAVYGGDKAIFGYGIISSHPNVSMTNLVSNTGVVASDVTGVGTGRSGLAAAGYST